MKTTKFKIGWIYEDSLGNKFKILHNREHPIYLYPINAVRGVIFEWFTQEGKYFNWKTSDTDLILESGKPEKSK